MTPLPAGVDNDDDALNFDTLDPALCANPYPYYARMRERHPVFWSDVERGWVVTRHAGAVECLGRAELSNSTVATLFARVANMSGVSLPEILKLFEVASFFQDPPQHGPQRLFLGQALAPEGGMAACSRSVERIASRLIAPVRADGEGDLLRQFAEPLPPLFMGWLYGLDDAETFHVVELLQGIPALLVDRARPLRVYRALEARLAQAHEFFRSQIALRRRKPGADALSRMLALDKASDVRRDDHTLAALAAFLFLAGFETTAALIGNGIHLLLSHPERASRLRQDPSSMPGLVQEVLRMEPPVQQTTRYVTQASVIADQAMEPGHRVVLLLAAANRDPRAYDNPDDFDPWRQGPAVLSLGGGAHACLGGGIARMETRVALALMLTLPSPVLSGEAPPRWREGQNLRRLEALPVRLG